MTYEGRESVSVDLKDAVLCVECESIYNNSNRICPRCCEPNGWLIQSWLSEQQAGSSKEAVEQHGAR